MTEIILGYNGQSIHAEKKTTIISVYLQNLLLIKLFILQIFVILLLLSLLSQLDKPCITY